MKPRIAIPDLCSYDTAYSRRGLPHYLNALERAGAEPVVVPLGISPEETARTIQSCSAVLLPGSKADIDPQKYGEHKHSKTAPADPQRDAADELLLQDAYNMRKPVFGICYGLQSLNVWRSGTLVQHLETNVNHSPGNSETFVHEVEVEAGSQLAAGIERTVPAHGYSGQVHSAQSNQSQRIAVNSSHHQAPKVPGDGLKVSARSSADGVIEALEGTALDHYVLAVQWHPEKTFDCDVASRSLFENFVGAARMWLHLAGVKD